MTLRGRLLVATPLLADPNFVRTVVLVLDHGDEGALGVVLNRATDTLVAEAIEPWAGMASVPAVVFLGGPVGGDQVIGLGWRTDREPASGWAPLFSDLGSVDLEAGSSARSVVDLRVFVGHAGWGAGQLEEEIEEASWFVVGADLRSDVFGADPDRLWADVLRRQPGRTAWFANAPEDLSAN
ncbi:MAG: YqgE/AlgH family protein [Acidimicrobiia bacterium]